MKNIVISFTEGRVVRDWFDSGFIEKLISNKFSVSAFTPAARVPSFVEKWDQEGINFFPIDGFFLEKKELRTLAAQEHLVRSLPSLLPVFSFIENNLLMPPDLDIATTMENINPDLVVISNPMEHYEYPVFSAAKKLKIPTLGVIRSWDNLYKGLRIRPNYLAVWNQINKEEACRLMKYDSSHVRVIGATQFDPYFSIDSNWTREELARAFKFDPSSPIITLAALGPFQHQYDETYLLDWLIAAREKGEIPPKSQIVCRLHPASRLAHFLPYLKFPDVRLSYMTKHIPTLDWTMTRDDIVLVGNLLRHSDVVVSPGSTITLETAIFDTPIIVPIFHEYQPDLAKRQYEWHFANHFGRLKTEKLVPIIEKSAELAPAIMRALDDRSWFREERKRLVREYIQYTDGKSSERLISLIGELVSKNEE